MIAAWMLYAGVISLLLSAAAAIAEHALTPGRHARRWLWSAAMLLSLALPPAIHELSEERTTQRAIVALANASQPAGSFLSESPIEWVSVAPPIASSPDADNRWLLGAWAAASTLLLAIYFASWVQIRKRLRHGRVTVVEETPVTVADDIGPAVVGFIRPRIVIPGWLLDAAPATRDIALTHEREHLQARDAQLFGAALMLVTLLPWNLPLWWQIRRLRLAIEVDCDARVLRGGRDPIAYGNVLLDMASRLSAGPLTRVALSESGSLLEKRIRLMKSISTARWTAFQGLLTSCALVLAATAATVAPPAVDDESASSGSWRLLSPVSDQAKSDQMIANSVTHFYPQLAREKQDGVARVWAVVNKQGEVAATTMELLPFWDNAPISDAEWATHLQQFGIAATDSNHSVHLRTRIGPNTVEVVWVLQPQAVAMDASAPRMVNEVPGENRVTEKLLAAAAAQRAAIARFDPDAMENGLSAGEELWFLIDADGSVVSAGRRRVLADPQAARADLQARYPGIRVAYVSRGTAVKDAGGKRIPVSWQWLERGSPLPR